MEKEKITKKILFNSLLVLTIIFIFILFFPKKSYIETKLDNSINNESEETFKNNINSLKIASIAYLKENDKDTVSLQELIDKNLLVELKDSNGNTCSNESNAKKENDKIIITLKCSDKEDKIEEDLEIKKKKIFCLYEYRKDIEKGYSNWSEWSDWSTNKIEKNDLTNVEEKVEKEKDGTETIINTREIYIDAYQNEKIACPNGYVEENGKCKIRTKMNNITASVSYSCPEGYSRSGLNCYSSNDTISATKNYYCPTSQGNIEFELKDQTCVAYRTSYIDSNKKENYYTCPEGYELNGTECITTEEYEEEIEKYKDVKYYRYQTRKETSAKFDIIWSYKDNKNLLDDSYNMIREISCDF